MLPEEIISDIITRLPTETILDCKLVSKTWRNLIQHPSFSRMHLNRLNHYGDSGKSGFLAFAAETKQLYYFEYIENREKPIDRIRKFNPAPLFKCNTFVGSVNGLICLKGRKNRLSLKERFCICNPMTKEYVILPEHVRDSGRYQYRWTGFGYLPSTNEYKVVLVREIPKQFKFVEVMVYTLGSGNGWRNIGNLGLKDYFVPYEPAIFVNGALHWRDVIQKTILVFDLADEKFREDLSPPPPPIASFLTLGVISGTLCCTLYFNSFPNQSHSDLWLYKNKNDNHDIKEQDEHQSFGWTKEVTLVGSRTPLAFTKSSGVLSYSSRYLDIYDPKAVTSKRLLDFKEPVRDIFSHMNTLVSLEEVGEENIRRVESVKIPWVFILAFVVPLLVFGPPMVNQRSKQKKGRD